MNAVASSSRRPVVLALCAHPDDIEFTCAGTLGLLAARGFETHYLNLADGCCGSLVKGPEEAAAERWVEAQAAAKLLGAVSHPPLFHDLEVFFNDSAARRVAAVMRRIQPQVVITHAVEDYMEDHMETARLAWHGLFAAGMPNYRTQPPAAPYDKPRALYHVLPHGLRRPADRTCVLPEFFVNIESVMERKREALAAHVSQKDWLDRTQGMNAYLDTMTDFARVLGRDSGRFDLAEGFTRHLSLGLGPEDYRPLEDALADLVHFRSP